MVGMTLDEINRQGKVPEFGQPLQSSALHRPRGYTPIHRSDPRKTFLWDSVPAYAAQCTSHVEHWLGIENLLSKESVVITAQRRRPGYGLLIDQCHLVLSVFV